MNRWAFSLIEVLVAMVIVSLITTTGMFSFKLAINQIDRQSGVGFDEAMRFTQIKNLLNATYFYIEEKEERFIVNELFTYEYLFEKSSDEITFVSDAPIYSQRLSLVQLKLVENKLIYKESPIYDIKQNYKKPDFFEDAVEHIIFLKMENPKFSYEAPIDLPSDITSKIPKLVKLEFSKNGQVYTYIFDIKYDFYYLKQYLKSKRITQ
ncbi:type II secretion system protein [Sulfurimonas sp. MAG313]|nr:type II secretion system protein [Sulfurimonas sp. MAG313]MDF1881739.1 type II secretion system protein [Sulfurimonas sp. MAG313]